MKKLLSVLFVLLLLPLASARIFWYSDEIDRQNNIDYAHSNSFDGITAEDEGDFDKYNCISLDDYNDYADYNKYDGYESLTADTASEKDLSRLRRDDYNIIANQNPSDSIEPDDFNSYGDMGCFNLKDYNSFAETDDFDRWDDAVFDDFDDIYVAKKVGKDRMHFFDFSSDFDGFDLQKTQPRPNYYEPYHRNSPYPYFGYGFSREDY